MKTDIKINGKPIDSRIKICESSLYAENIKFYEIYVEVPKGESIKGRFVLGRLHKGIIEWKEDGELVKGKAYIQYNSSKWIWSNADGSKYLCKEFALERIV